MEYLIGGLTAALIVTVAVGVPLTLKVYKLELKIQKLELKIQREQAVRNKLDNELRKRIENVAGRIHDIVAHLKDDEARANITRAAEVLDDAAKENVLLNDEDSDELW